MKKLNELLAEIATKNTQVSDLFDAADKRGDGVSTKDEIETIKALNREIGELEKQAADLKEVHDIRTATEGRSKAARTPIPGVPFNGAPGGNGAQAAAVAKSLGEEILADEGLKSWLKQWDGRPPTQQAINSPRVEIKTLLTGAGSTSAGPLVFSDFKRDIVDASYARPLTLRDIITIGQTDSDTVEYVRVTGVTNAAAAVAEATATADGTGAKPESAMAMLRVSETVKTLAHWIPATNRALADAAQLRTLIDNFLRYGIEEELEDQVITGTGSGENFTGILNLSGTTAQAFSTDILQTTRKARTKVRVTGRARATAFVMHPNDWETIDLLQDNEARYYYGGPSRLGNPTLWGLPVVECEAMTEGYTVCADWRLAVLWDRLQTSISMTNSHSDFFVRNLVAILAEMRAAFGVIRPAAFVIADLTA